MKPASFKYHRPENLNEALQLMASYGGDAKPLAGGQSLIPAMNFRLAQPAVLIDLNHIAPLAYVQKQKSELRIGAMTRHAEVERSPLVADLCPLLHETMPSIAHLQIRNRGTIGGSIAHADPAAELPAVMLALQARFRLQSLKAERWVAADDFFTGLLSTALNPDELLVEIAIDESANRTGWAFEEMSRRHGDYALIGVAVLFQVGFFGKCKTARITFLSAGDAPILAKHASDALIGQELTAELISHAAELAATKDVDPPSDIHASANFRRHLVRTLTKRALMRALSRPDKKS